MVLLAADGVARLAPESGTRRPIGAFTPICSRQVGGDLDVLRQQPEREAGGEGAAQHVLLDQVLAAKLRPVEALITSAMTAGSRPNWRPT